MKLHADAALSLKQRERMVGLVVGGELTIAEAAERLGISTKTCSKWVSRF